MKKFMKYCVFGTLAATVIFFVLGCSKDGPANNTVAAASKPGHDFASPVTPAVDYYETSGPIVVENQVEILAQHDGVVSQLFAETGKEVKKDDVLAQLDDRQLLAEREIAKAKI